MTEKPYKAIMPIIQFINSGESKIRNAKKISFNIESNDGWWWSSWGIPFADAWPIIQDHVLHDYILIIELTIRQGRFWDTTPDAKTITRFGINTSSSIEIGKHTKFLIVTKSELGKLSQLQCLSSIHWIDCNKIPSSDSINEIYATHYKDNMFEDAFMHKIARKFDSSAIFFAVGTNETRIETHNKALLNMLLTAELNFLIRSKKTGTNIEITTCQLDQVIEAIQNGHRPMTLKTKNILLTESGFRLVFKKLFKTFVLET